MPWQPLPRIAFAVATYPFIAALPADLPLELGDELYIIEQGGDNTEWLRGYLVAPPSLLAGLTSVKGQTLETRVFSGIFPRSCVEVREVLGEDEEHHGGGESGGDKEGNGVPNGVVSPPNTPTPPMNGTSKPTLIRRKSTNINGLPMRKEVPHGYTNGNPNSSVRSAIDPNAQKPPAPVPLLKIGDETPTSASEPLVDEIASCLREWHSTHLHELLLSRQYPLLDRMSALVQKLDLSRRQFLHNVLTTHEVALLREKTVWDLVEGNKMLSGEIIVRDPRERGRVLTGEDSAIEISKLQSMMSLLEEKPILPTNETLTLHHLLVDVKAFVGASTEPTTLVFFLASRTPGLAAIPLSESYIVDVPPSGSLTSLAKSSQMRTLFTDLASGDIGDLLGIDSELYLVVKVRSAQQVVGGKPASRGGGGSRNGTVSQEGTVSSKDKPPSSSIGKAGRQSLMWGQTAKRKMFSKNAPVSSMLNSVSEQEDERDSHENPPSTAGSIGRASGRNVDARVGQVTQIVAKTVGIGVLKLNSVMKQDQEVEQVISIWSPTTGLGQEQGDGWDDVIPELMESKSRRYEKSRRAERLQVHLTSFNNPNADALIKATPTLLADVTKTSKMGFSGAPTTTRSDIYITIDEAFLPKHALLSRSTGGAIPVSNNLVASNLQITMEVRKASGERLEGVIFSSSNAEGEGSWESTATERGEGWNQTLRLAIPPNEVSGCHLVMVIADSPNFPFAICHLPLWDQSAFIRDGHHSLLLYRYDESTSTARENNIGKGGYLNLPWNARGKDDVSKDEAVTGPIATLRIQTYLCSTKFSQDKVLLGLLKWKEQPSGEVQELLKRLVFVPEIEIVKLLNDVFDAIFGILVEHTGDDDYEDLIFSALVTVLGIVHDRRFNLGPLVDHYAEHKFSYPFATPCLVRSFTRLLSNPADAESSRKLRATFKVVRHILKFITQSRDQQKVKEADLGITHPPGSPGFTRQLRQIFKSLDGLMRNTAPILVGSQTLAVQHFHTWLPELTGLLSTEEILHIAIDFMDSCALVSGKLVLYKLVLIINYSRLDLFSQPEQKQALCTNTVRWIAPHWGKTGFVSDQYRDQVRLCCSILATQVNALGPEIPDYVPKVIGSYVTLQAQKRLPKNRLSLLFPTTYPFPSKPVPGGFDYDEALIELSAILSALSSSPAGLQLEMADDELATLLEDTLHVHLSILQCDAFPPSWLSVHIYHHKSTMSTLEYLAGILQDNFLPHPDDAESYHTALWRVFFTTLLKLVGSDALALETFPEQKRRAVWKIAGDVREHGADLLRRTWESIGWETGPDDRQIYGLSRMGGYQVQYVPSLVGPIIELCLSVHEGLRRVAVEVLQSMIISEYILNQDITAVQTEMIDCLDTLFKSKPLTESLLQKIFINELLDLYVPLSQIPDDPLYVAIKELIATVDEFLDLLVAVHTPDATGEASHMIHRLRLMEFLRDIQKEVIFIRYVHQLAELQSNARNYTEAGLALRLHADLYEWDPTKILKPLKDPEFPAQSQFDRKERIYFDIIKHFEDGEAWSSALDAYKELQIQYEENVYDYPKLARTERAIATIYETIGKSDKLVRKYFKVTYKGMGFPPSLRDKEFVFEGAPTERSSAFTDRMQEQHPSAQIVASADIEELEGQFLHIIPLGVHRDLDHHVYQRARIPQVIRDYLLTAQPQFFSLTTHRNTTGPVLRHSAEKTLFQTAESFPTVLQRSEVIATERISLSPAQSALERIVRKTHEMTIVEKKVAGGELELASLLIEAINISCNPTADSSVSRYRELIPSNVGEEDEGLEEVELQPIENALKIALIDHALMIRRCLQMFANSSTINVRETHEDLYQNFETTFAPELASFTFPAVAKLVGSSSDETRTSWSPTYSLSRDSSESTIQTNTNNNVTINTSILNSPHHQNNGHTRGASSKRLSFLNRGMAFEEGKLGVNGMNGMNGGGVNGTKPKEASKAPAKRSFFANNSNLLRGRNASIDEKVEEEREWVTQSDLSTVSKEHPNGYRARSESYNGTEKSGRRSSSSQRPDTATSGTASPHSKVGSVRKRFSLMHMGGKIGLGRKRSEIGKEGIEEE